MRILVVAVLALTLGSCIHFDPPVPTPVSKVPCGPTEVFTRHEHAHLTIIVRGELRTVPAFIGITATSICWLHTHDTSGIIHIEAGDDRLLTLGDFFGVWGQPLNKGVLDGETVRTSEQIEVRVNQHVVTGFPEALPLHEHDDIVLQLGPPFLQLQPYVWPPGY